MEQETKQLWERLNDNDPTLTKDDTIEILKAVIRETVKIEDDYKRLKDIGIHPAEWVREVFEE